MNNELEKKSIKYRVQTQCSMMKLEKKKQKKKEPPHSLSMNNEGCESYPHLFLVYSIIFQDFLNVYI